MTFTWIKEEEHAAKRYWYHSLCERILKAGPIPQHVAFIMDGNRRFAKSKNIERKEGHAMGFEKLAEALQWCRDLGIKEVTVYAFSIENFKRSQEEVSGLMDLAREKFSRLLDEKELLDKHEVCIRVLGNLTMLPLDLQEMVAEAMYATRNNTRSILNICFAYTSREEICSAMKDTAEGVQMGIIKENDISEYVLEQCLYTRRSPHPDLLVRTSGEVRLSDFLLWQTMFTILSFIPVLWPEINRWHLYGGILNYQRNISAIKKAKEYYTDNLLRQQKETDRLEVLRDIENQKSAGIYDSSVTLQQRMEQKAQGRQQRINKFLEHIESKRNSYIETLAHRRKLKPSCQV